MSKLWIWFVASLWAIVAGEKVQLRSLPSLIGDSNLKHSYFISHDTSKNINKLFTGVKIHINDLDRRLQNSEEINFYDVNDQKVRILNVIQFIDDVDVDLLNTAPGFSRFGLIFKQAVLATLSSEVPNDDMHTTFDGIVLLDFEIQLAMRRKLLNLQRIELHYQIELYARDFPDSTSLDDSTTQRIQALTQASTDGNMTLYFNSIALSQQENGFSSLSINVAPNIVTDTSPVVIYPRDDNWLFNTTMTTILKVDNMDSSYILTPKGQYFFNYYLSYLITTFLIKSELKDLKSLTTIPISATSCIVMYTVDMYTPSDDVNLIYYLSSKWQADLTTAIQIGSATDIWQHTLSSMTDSSVSNKLKDGTFTVLPVFPNSSNVNSLNTYFNTKSLTKRYFGNKVPIVPISQVPILEDIMSGYRNDLLFIDYSPVSTYIMVQVEDVMNSDFGIYDETMRTILPYPYNESYTTEYAAIEYDTNNWNAARRLTSTKAILKSRVEPSECTTVACYANVTKYLKEFITESITSGDFMAVFNQLVREPVTSNLGIAGMPFIYLNSYPPSPDGKLVITQQIDDVGSLSSLSSTQRKKVENAIAAIVNSFLPEVVLNDIKIKDIDEESNHSYMIEYSILLHFNRTYGEKLGEFFQNILSSAVVTDQFTSQLQLASSSYFYDITQLSTATSSVLPTFDIKFKDDDIPRNTTVEKKIKTIDLSQEMNGIDLDRLNDVTGYTNFKLSFRQAIAEILSTSIDDITFKRHRIKTSRRMLLGNREGRLLVNTGSIVSDYSVNVYSNATDPNTANTLSNSITSTLSNAVTSGTFTSTFTSAAFNNGETSFSTASASTPPYTTTTSTDSEKKESFSLIKGSGIALLVFIIIVPLAIILGVLYYCVFYHAK